MVVLLLVATFLGATGLSAAAVPSFGWFAYQPLADATFFPGSLAGWQITDATLAARALDPAFLLLTLIAALFLWGARSPRTQPFMLLFDRLIAPRLQPAQNFENPRPARFAQYAGLIVTMLGMLLHLAGVPLSLPIAAALAFIASFLKAAFGLCLGCRFFLVLSRLGLVPRRGNATA